MGRLSRLLLAALLAAVAMGAATATAEASREIGITGGGIVLAGSLTFTGGGGVTVICTASLAGVLQTSVRKEVGYDFGSITSATFVGCSGFASVRQLRDSTPGVYYESFQGTLPNLTGMLFVVEIFDLLFTMAIGQCLYIGSLLLRLNAAGTTAVVLGDSGFLLFGTLAGLCPSPLRVAGTLTMVPAQPLVLR